MFDDKKYLILDYITKEECYFENDFELFNCNLCSCIEECYIKSCERCNSEYVKSIDYGGYNTEEMFWESI